jgi:hypothetical protein
MFLEFGAGLGYPVLRPTRTVLAHDDAQVD